MACQSVVKQSLITGQISRLLTSLACLTALSPLAPAALASPWLTRAHHIVSSHSVAPAAIYRCHQHHRLSPITTRLPLAHITAPPPPIQGDGLVSINPPLCTTLPPTLILIKTTLPQTISSSLPVSLPLVLLNKRSRPRHDILQ